MMDAMKLDVHESTGMVHFPSPRHPVSEIQTLSSLHDGHVLSPRIEVTSELDDGPELHVTSPIPIPNNLWRTRSPASTNSSRPSSACEDSTSTSVNSSAASSESADHDQAIRGLPPFDCHAAGGDLPVEAADYDPDMLLREPSPMPHAQYAIEGEPEGQDVISRWPTPASPVAAVESDPMAEPKVSSKGKKGKSKGKK